MFREVTLLVLAIDHLEVVSTVHGILLCVVVIISVAEQMHYVVLS